MIQVVSSPEVTPAAPNCGGRWELVFWVCDSFNYTTPFRSSLNEMVGVLGQARLSSIQLPEFEANEDCISGILQFGNELLLVYYEYSLSYLKLSHDSHDVLLEVASLLTPKVIVNSEGPN